MLPLTASKTSGVGHLSTVTVSRCTVGGSPAHALKATYDEVMACKESGESKVILFNCSGHGHFDLAAYDAYHRKELPDYELEEAKLELALAGLPKIE